METITVTMLWLSVAAAVASVAYTTMVWVELAHRLTVWWVARNNCHTYEVGTCDLK